MNYFQLENVARTVSLFHSHVLPTPCLIVSLTDWQGIICFIVMDAYSQNSSALFASSIYNCHSEHTLFLMAQLMQVFCYSQLLFGYTCVI